jgi:hypothetical protein
LPGLRFDEEPVRCLVQAIPPALSCS